uniref:AB hydrolase-1 domain-containing protein n=1 Tax=Noctiluca scintillans TaxID=2966 RepID=A0A7S1FDD6_NOCSC|mmetsp:Transcript_55141/g.147170  ORF Transcript_55141/g.147170 Transcript_55141/m.147170 type:complete len:586 (+) Transcript_55141:53-1810(+)
MVTNFIFFLCVLFCAAAGERASGAEDWKEHANSGRRRRRSLSQYKASPSWEHKSFDEQWHEFQNSVPIERLQGQPGDLPNGFSGGASCAPWIWGPEDGENLLILVHGYLACPGRWGVVVEELLKRDVVCGRESDGPQRPCGRYRIMGVTLPGHGYKWEERPAIVTQNSGSAQVERRDNITDMPFDKDAWLVFNEALGVMATQFKKEHPTGVIAIAGHSIGGLMAMDVVLKRPTIFDRILIMNPELGPPSQLLNPMNPLIKHVRLSNDLLGEACEPERDGHLYSGGYCQFKFGHIGSVWELARHLYCNEWSISRCVLTGWAFNSWKYHQARHNMSVLKSIQMVTTKNDPAVEEKRILRFMSELHTVRPAGHPNTGVCMWPEVMTHSYLIPSFAKEGHPGGPQWWKDYAMEALMRYLTHGKTIDIVERIGLPGMEGGREDFCMPTTSAGVVGAKLAVLPAVQNKHSYSLTGPAGQTLAAMVLFQGFARKETENVHAMNNRMVELLQVDGQYVIVTRLARDAGLRDMFIVHAAARQQNCLKVDLAKLDPQANLLADLRAGREDTPQTLMFCARRLAEAYCSRAHCGHY